MTRELEWTSQEEYGKQALRDWYIDGEVAGRTRSFGKLTFATIRDAGHMVRLRFRIIVPTSSASHLCSQAPYDQPVRSLELANRWLAGQDL